MADNKAFAKAVAPRKTFIFALQKSIKHLSLLVAFRQTLFQIKPLLSAKTLPATKTDMRAILIITSLFLASCITTLKPPTPNNDRQPLSEATISKLNGDYDVESKSNSNITLDFALTFDKDPKLSKVTIEAVDAKHIKAKLYNRDSLIISGIIKGKIKDDYFVFTRRNVSPFWFIINGFGKKTARLGVLNNGDLIVDSRHIIVATIIILPFTGGREQQYDLIFTKQLGSR